MDEDRTSDAVEAVIEKEQAATDAGEKARDKKRRQQQGSAPTHRGSNIPYAMRLMMALVLTAIMTALITAGILGIVWQGQFQKYTYENMENLATHTAERIANAYEKEESFDSTTLAGAQAASSVYNEIDIQVIDAQGTTVYDDSWDTDSTSTGTTGVSLAPTRKQVASAPIMVDGATVGTVKVWIASGGELLTDTDVQFRDSSFQALIAAALVAVLLAAFVGSFIARSFLEPVQKVTAAANSIKRGNLSARTGMQGSDEISQLGETFDEMAESIQRDRELERRLTTDVAHELRTPLMGIQATVEAIMDGVFPADEERLAAINSETMRLKRLVEALLNLSRLESGSVPFNEKQIDLVELISGLFMSHEALLEAAELTAKFEADDTPVIVDGDSDLLRQATANLISNAVRYNEPGGKVTVGVHRRGDMGAISVSDTGIGIAPEDKDRVFSRFWRADTAREHAHGGLGVGLAVVKEIVDYHNGKIEVESEVGQGTTFTILIPLHVFRSEKEKRTWIENFTSTAGKIGEAATKIMPAGKDRGQQDRAREKGDKDTTSQEDRKVSERAGRERRTSADKAEREQKAAADKAEREQKAAEEKAERERKAAEKAIRDKAERAKRNAEKLQKTERERAAKQAKAAREHEEKLLAAKRAAVEHAEKIEQRRASRLSFRFGLSKDASEKNEHDAGDGHPKGDSDEDSPSRKGDGK